MGAADFDGNGKPDLVWQNDTTREATAWFTGGAQGTTLLGWAYLCGPVPGGRIIVPR